MMLLYLVCHIPHRGGLAAAAMNPPAPVQQQLCYRASGSPSTHTPCCSTTLLPQDVIIFGAEDFDTTEMREKELAKGGIPLGIGANTTMRKVVVDRNARIGANCSITNKEGIVEATRESEGICIRDGILVVMRDAVIPAGTVI